MRRQNQQGPAPVGVMTEPAAMTVDAFARTRGEGAVVLDCRQPEAFGGGHIPRALNVGLGASFPTWAGSILPPDRPVLLVLERPDDLLEVTWHLLRIGYDIPIGWLAEGMMGWRTAGREIDFVPQWTVGDLADRLKADRTLFVLDVRQPAEWQAGRVPGAVHISGGELAGRHDEVPRDRPIAVYCGSGYRSSVATSVLKAHGRKEVYNVLGGFAAWKARKLPIARPS
jgi:hydroxyacylglutathione hydrolase